MKAGIAIQPTTDITSAEYLSERVIDCYKSLDVSSLGQLQSLYSEDVYFEDPSHAFQGRPALMRYFESMFENVDSCSSNFINLLIMAATSSCPGPCSYATSACSKAK